MRIYYSAVYLFHRSVNMAYNLASPLPPCVKHRLPGALSFAANLVATSIAQYRRPANSDRATLAPLRHHPDKQTTAPRLYFLNYLFCINKLYKRIFYFHPTLLYVCSKLIVAASGIPLATHECTSKGSTACAKLITFFIFN